MTSGTPIYKERLEKLLERAWRLVWLFRIHRGEISATKLVAELTVTIAVDKKILISKRSSGIFDGQEEWTRRYSQCVLLKVHVVQWCALIFWNFSITTTTTDCVVSNGGKRSLFRIRSAAPVFISPRLHEIARGGMEQGQIFIIRQEEGFVGRESRFFALNAIHSTARR